MQRPVASPLNDRVELDFLSALQDRQAVLALDRRIAEHAAFGREEPMRPLGGDNKVAKVDTEVRLRDDDMAIQNRCPTITTNNIHGIPAWTIMVSLLAAVVLAAAIIVGVLWYSRVPSRPGPDAPTSQTSGAIDVGFFDN